MKILILSRNINLYSTQSLMEAIRKRGHEVQVYDHLMCNIIVEKNKPKVMIGLDDLGHFDAVIPRIGASATAYGAAIIRQFEAMGVFVTVTAEALLKARDKLHCMQILSAVGIDVPKTGVSAGDFSAGAVYDRVSKERAVIKLLSSTQGLGVILAHSKNQGISIVEGFHRVGQEILIQEFIQDAKESDLRVFVVDGEVVGAMVRQAVPGEFRSNIHRGATATVAKLSMEEHDMAIESTKRLGLAIAGVDILRSGRGPLILEVNASPGLEGIETTTQKDIAGKIVEYIERQVKK
ncbi:MAG: RimK family alpha-L-glutamate ligase [Saprospiraceae bacterium]|nr:RimK family alpha-L-glutamate ligase [Candidatus Vicinibacter affinis]